jgi:hypothetical protein
MTNYSVSKVSARLIASVLAVASLAPVLNAQNPGFAARMNVPFAFDTPQGQHLPPGVYTIHMEGSQTMVIQGQSTSSLGLVQLANDGLEAKTGKAVFTKYGNRYFLRAVWIAGDSSHMVLNPSKAESGLQVAGKKATTGVELALLRASR